MDLAELQRRVDRHASIDLRPFHDAYRARGGADTDGFLAFLGAQRAVGPSVLKELYAATGVETPAARDPVYQGTLLGKWANGETLADTRPNRPGSDPTVSVGPAADERFQSISRLGEGAMGAIDIARDVYLRRKVALKTVLPEMAGHPEVFGRFLSEMQITAQLEHPNIVPVYALDVRADGSIGYAMKLVQGRDLEAMLDEARKKVESGEPLGEDLALEKRLEIFLKVCDALEYAHSKGIVHRDLKPANIMIGRHNEVYVMDWGIARAIGDGGKDVEVAVALPPESGLADAEISRTRIGDAIGTPQYMSPEQAQGKNPELDGKSDQYAMGLILQECVTLKTAVNGNSLQEVLTKAILARRDPVAVGNRAGALPREIDAIVRRATRAEPKERYPDIRALADDVRRYLRGEPVHALPEGGLRRAGRWLAKHRTATLVLVMGLGLVGAVGTIGALVVGQSRVDAEHARELRVSQMAAESAIQTQLVDRELTRYEAALSELVGAVQIVLSKEPASEVGPTFAESFGSKDTAPPDLAASKRYGREVSVLAAVTALVPGVAREPLETKLKPLGLLGPAFRAALLASSGVDWRGLSLAEQRALIADAGVPAYRASITLREGVVVSFPGMALRLEKDPRETAAFKAAESKDGIVWGAPVSVDGEQILPAGAALHDEQGAFRGVAVLEVSVGRLLSRPDAPELDYVQSRSLVGRDGKLIVEDSKSRIPLAPEVVAAIAAGKSGTLVAEVDGKRYRYAYHPLATLDWYYVAAGEEGQVLDSKRKLDTSDPRKAIAAQAQAQAKPANPKPATPPKPAPAASAKPEAADAGAETPDAGAESADAGAGPRKLGGPWPKASADPSGDAPLPPNPFEKWKAYDRKKKK